MKKRRKFIPLFKEQDSEEQEDTSMPDHSPTWEKSPEDYVKSQEKFDDSSHADQSDADMGNTSPEDANYTF
eukprot:11742811-Alexandrium_andersonii.AAC.1